MKLALDGDREAFDQYAELLENGSAGHAAIRYQRSAVPAVPVRRVAFYISKIGSQQRFFTDAVPITQEGSLSGF